MLVDLSNHGVLKVSGPDSKRFLQGQLTIDLETLSPHKSLCAHCNPQGRVLSLFQIVENKAAYYLIMPRNLVAYAKACLEKYAIFYKTRLSDESNALRIIGYRGIFNTEWQSRALMIIADGLRHIIFGDENAVQPVWQKLKNESPETSYNQWKAQDLRDGIPAIYPETSGKFLPHDLNLHQLNALSFDKGCYTGQEIIARMHYRGKPKNRLFRARIAVPQSFQPGVDIYAYEKNKESIKGSVVDVCYEKADQYNVLILTHEANAVNNYLYLAGHAAFFTILEE